MPTGRNDSQPRLVSADGDHQAQISRLLHGQQPAGRCVEEVRNEEDQKEAHRQANEAFLQTVARIITAQILDEAGHTQAAARVRTENIR